MVRAFYDGKLDREQDHVKIKKLVVLFDVWEVNRMFSLPNDSDAKWNRIIKSPTRIEMDEALKLLTKPESKWNTSPKGIRTLGSNCLTLEAHLWL